MSGIELIQFLQSFSTPALDRIWVFITDIHHENWYILMLPLLLWFYDKRFARYMISVFIISVWSNSLLKDLFGTARPSPDQVRWIVEESSKAFPSGHSQGPMMVWGALALEFGTRWFTVIAAALVFLIGFSRLYLGVHWPIDILGGWAIGALLLWGFERTRSFWTGEQMAFARRLLWATVIPLATLVIASVALHDAPAFNTPKDEAGYVWILTGAFLGFWIGSILEERYVGFEPRQGGLLQQILKGIIGVVLVLGIKEGAKLVLPAIAAGDLVRYFLVALAATLVAPWLFRRFITPTPAGRSIAG